MTTNHRHPCPTTYSEQQVKSWLDRHKPVNQEGFSKCVKEFFRKCPQFAKNQEKRLIGFRSVSVNASTGMFRRRTAEVASIWQCILLAKRKSSWCFFLRANYICWPNHALHLPFWSLATADFINSFSFFHSCNFNEDPTTRAKFHLVIHKFIFMPILLLLPIVWNFNVEEENQVTKNVTITGIIQY